MTNHHAKAEMADVLDEVQHQMRMIAQVQQERAKLIGTATVRKRVTVSVNADGIVIETVFGPGIEELTYGDIAKAVTEAAQQAAADVARKIQELAAPLHVRRARLPKLSDIIEGMPDFSKQLPEVPKVSIAPPGAPDRRADRTGAGVGVEFSNVETYDHDGAKGRGVTDSSW